MVVITFVITIVISTSPLSSSPTAAIVTPSASIHALMLVVAGTTKRGRVNDDVLGDSDAGVVDSTVMRLRSANDLEANDKRTGSVTRKQRTCGLFRRSTRLLRLSGNRTGTVAAIAMGR
jgi:hypothetical protein